MSGVTAACPARTVHDTARSNSVQSLVITGISSGIGYETARLAIEKGARVFGSVRAQADGERLKSEFGDAFTPLVFDVRNENAVRNEAARVRALLSGRTLSGLVNNAGTGVPGPLLYQPMEEVRLQLDTNLLSAFIVTQAFLPLLGADRTLSGAPGRIVNMSSIGGKIGQPFATAYSASKHGLEGFSEALRRELMRFDIRVIVVGPSTVRTPIWGKIAPLLGRYAGTEFAEAFDAGVRLFIERGSTAQEPREIAMTVWDALTAKHPRLRYAPARHPVLEQALLRALPRRALDWAMRRGLGLRPTAATEAREDRRAA
jgi:NAD(P)-dependent dehydrogenase (short-subunit alcohol dehydrogenase family)